MDWQKELDELRRREELASQLGGPERVKRQHDGGRLTIRERIAKLVDSGSFHEIGKIAGRAIYDDDNELTKLVPSNCSIWLRNSTRLATSASRTTALNNSSLPVK